MIAAYVTGHGFGHATRTAEVLRVVRGRAPSVRLAVVTSAPERLFREAVSGELEVRSEACDVGLVQESALAVDEPGSFARWQEFVGDWDARVDAEARWLRTRGARLVLGDVPPLAFAAAARAGLPSVALANFSWDWIYRHLAAREAGFLGAARWAEGAYRQATLLLRLPFHGDLSAFRRIEDLPLVARQPRLTRRSARARLDLGDGVVALWSFGGHALPTPGYEPLRSLAHIRFIVTGGETATPPNVLRLGDEELGRRGLSYIDLVAAADVVVCKPGYGIVSDALATRTRMVYTDRGDFPEYPILVEGMERLMPCAYVPSADLLAGRIGSALEAVMAVAWPAPPRLDGASLAAERLLRMLSPIA